MVSEGGGGHCTPLGAVSGESSSSLCLPPRVPVQAGRGVLGGGGAIWIVGLVLALAWDDGETPLVKHLWRAQDKQKPLLLCSGRFGWREEAAQHVKVRLPKI